jgi:hypothetical protein
MALDEHWLTPEQPPTPRESAKIIARGGAGHTTEIVVLADGSYLVAHHEGLARSAGGITHRDRDGAIRAARTGVSGPMDASRSMWLASGPRHDGSHASLCLLDPTTLEPRETLPLARPLCWLSESTLLAHTPPPNGAFDKKTHAYTRLPGFLADPALLARVKLPETPGLVAFDLDTREARLLLEASPHDGFVHATLSPDQRVLFAATRGGRVVALRREDATVLWERPSPGDCTRFSLLVFALSPDGAQLVSAGAGLPHDCLVIDAATGATRRELAVRRAVDAKRLSRRSAAHVEALAFHRDGDFALGTSSGAIVIVRRDQRISAFKAAPCAIRALAFSRDGRELVSGGPEECLRVWPFEPAALGG